MKHLFAAALILFAKLTAAATDDYDDYTSQKSRKYVEPSDDLKKTLDSLSVEDQVDLMLETLEREVEAEGREAAFEELNLDARIDSNTDYNDVEGMEHNVIVSHVSDEAADWNDGSDENFAGQDQWREEYVTEDEVVAWTMDEEDFMEEDEWEEFYEENIATSSADPVYGKEIEELKQLQREIENGEEIDKQELAQVKRDFLIESLDDGTLIAFGYEIKDWKNKLFWHAVYWYVTICFGAFFIVGLIYYDQKKEEAAK